MSRDIFGYHNWGKGATDYLVMRCQEVVKRPMMHRTALPSKTKNYLAPNVNVSVEKPSSRTAALAFYHSGVRGTP